MACHQSWLSLGGSESREGWSADWATVLKGCLVLCQGAQQTFVTCKQATTEGLRNDRILGSFGEERKPPRER